MRWAGIPSGNRSACLASAGRSPWHGARSLAALSTGGMQRGLERSQSVAFLPWCFMCSGWMPSMPGALPVFRRCVARSISCAVKLVDRLESHPGALNSSWTLADVVRVKSLSALGKRPLLSRSDAMEFAVMGHCAGAVDLPVSLFRVCHPRRLECVKSIDSTVSIHRCLRFSFKPAE